MDWALYEFEPSKIRNYLKTVIELGQKVLLAREAEGSLETQHSKPIQIRLSGRPSVGY